MLYVIAKSSTLIQAAALLLLGITLKRNSPCKGIHSFLKACLLVN